MHSLIVLNVDYAPDYTPREIHRIARYLTERIKHRHEGHMPQIKTDSHTEKERIGYDALGYKHDPFEKTKICRTQKLPDKPLTGCTSPTTVFRK